MDSITVIFTCFNRIDKTRKCLESIADDKPDIRFIITDDSSTDGTAEMLEGKRQSEPERYTILHGDGNLFWAGGMRHGMDHYLKKDSDTDYVALVNDDVIFEKGALSHMIERSREKKNAVIAGATRDSKGNLSYGGIKYREGTVKCGIIPLEKADEIQCDTFNCNCVVIPNEIFRKAGSFDERYIHAMADYDYGFKIKRMGYDIYETDCIIGSCDDNSIKGTWKDTDLKRIDRLNKEGNTQRTAGKRILLLLKEKLWIGKGSLA